MRNAKTPTKRLRVCSDGNHDLEKPETGEIVSLFLFLVEHLKPPHDILNAFEAVEAKDEMRLVSVVVGLVGTVDGETEVVGLGLGHLGELDVELGQVRSGDLLVEGFGEHVHAEGVRLGVGPEGDLGHDLVGERAGHDERRVTGSAAEVDESTLGEQDDVSARLHGVSVHLGLDLDGLDGVLLEPCDVDLDIEVTDAAG